MDVIDVWMQHPSNDMFSDPMFSSLQRWTGQHTKTLPIQYTLTAMDTANITKGIICAWQGPSGILLPNSDVKAIFDTQPNRFAGLCTVDLRFPVSAVLQLRQCVLVDGFIGIRVIPWLWQLPPNDRRYYPLYVECVQLNVPFCLQVGHTGPLMPSEPGRPIPYLDDVAREFPDLTIVGGHIGYPWTNEMIALATKYPNVYIDTSAYTAQRYPQELVTYMNTNGKKKVLFGSNYPMIMPAKCLQGLDSLGLSMETKKLFLHDNAVRVFGLDKKRTRKPLPSKL